MHEVLNIYASEPARAKYLIALGRLHSFRITDASEIEKII